MKKFNLEFYGEQYFIELKILNYRDGNLAIQMVNWTDEEPEPWDDLTVNLPGLREQNCAFIDVNNYKETYLEFIALHNLAVPTGRYRVSGFCTYPEYRFYEDKLREIDSRGYKQYLKVQKQKTGTV